MSRRRRGGGYARTGGARRRGGHGTWRPEERGEGQRTRAPLLRQPSLHRLVLLARLRDLGVGAGDGGAQDRLLVADDGAAPRVERHLQQLLVVHDQHLGDHSILGLHVCGDGVCHLLFDLLLGFGVLAEQPLLLRVKQELLPVRHDFHLHAEWRGGGMGVRGVGWPEVGSEEVTCVGVGRRGHL